MAKTTIFSLITFFFLLGGAEATVMHILGMPKYNTGGMEQVGCKIEYYLPVEMNDHGTLIGKKIVHIPTDPYSQPHQNEKGNTIGSTVKYGSYEVREQVIYWNFGAAKYPNYNHFIGAIHMNNQNILLVEHELGAEVVTANKEVFALFPDDSLKGMKPILENDTVCFIDDEGNVVFRNAEEGIFYSQNVHDGTTQELTAEEVEEQLPHYQNRFKGNQGQCITEELLQDIDDYFCRTVNNRNTKKPVVVKPLAWEILDVVLSNDTGQMVVLAKYNCKYIPEEMYFEGTYVAPRLSYYLFIDLTQ